MKYMLPLLLFSLVSSAIATDDLKTDTEIIKQSDAAATPVARRTTISRDGQLLYRLFKPIDPDLIGTAMAPINETFFIDGHPVLELRRFPEFPKMTFSSFEDFSVSFSEREPISITASSLNRKISYIWSKDSEGLYTKFSERPYPDIN